MVTDHLQVLDTQELWGMNEDKNFPFCLSVLLCFQECSDVCLLLGMKNIVFIYIRLHLCVHKIPNF